MLSFLQSKLFGMLGSITLVLSILMGVFQYGRKDQREERRVEDMEDYVKTKERIDEVQPTDNRDANLRRLQRTGRIRR